MRVLLKQPGLPEEVIEIPNELKDLQKAVGGYITTVRITAHIVMICDEEGLLKERLPNCYIHGELYVGPLLFVGVDKENFRDLTDRDIATVKRLIKLYPWRNA